MMGARGRKRVRKNGQVASGRMTKIPNIWAVPSVSDRDLEYALLILRDTMRAAANPDEQSYAWQSAYQLAQESIRRELGTEAGDAALWRATFLDGLLSWDAFCEKHSEISTVLMIHVAARIDTYGGDTSFDVKLFENNLRKASLKPPRPSRPSHAVA